MSPAVKRVKDLKDYPSNVDDYAGLVVHLFALLLDFFVFIVFFHPLTHLFKGVWLMSPSNHRWANGFFITDPLCLVFLVLMVSYFILLEGYFGATLGKLIFGTRVIGVNGSPISLFQSVVHNLVRLIDGLPAFSILGVYLMWTSEQAARFGDRLAGTRVVHQ